MFNVVVEIKAPEIVEAVWALIGSLANTKIVSAPGQTASIIPPVQQPIQAQAQQAPMQPQQIQTQPQQLAPAQQQFQQPQQMQQMQPQAPVPGPVPTATQTFTLDQLAVAATALSDSGKRAEVIALLAAFGVQMLTALPQEQYGNFATHLRGMGANI